MASRNIKGLAPSPTIMQHDASPFDPTDKIQSNTLKRHPKMDLSKSDLLKLLSYLEGELQARDVVIATLKAEKAKQLLYQAKYGRFGLGDPFTALQRDSDNMKDSSFDESAIKLMYDNQLAQLENLIATQRKAQVKMREQLSAAEKRFHKATSELEDEKRKHAQDTAQGDDVTYMLEKERERLKQEVDFEKNQNKRLEKDLKKSLASLEEEKANSVKHKQVALMLIKERKKLEDVLLLEKHKRSTAESLLSSDTSRIREIVDGLEEESQRSLKMEAVMEKQLSEFDVEREQLKNKFAREEMRSSELQATVDLLSEQMESLQLQLAQERASASATPQSIEIRSSVSPSNSKEGSREGSLSDNSQYRKPATPAKPSDKLVANSLHGPNDISSGISSGTTVYSMPSGSKVLVHVGGVGGGNSPRKPMAAGRGTPPPVPPNKPVLAAPLPGNVREGMARAVSPKPVPPPKVGVSLSKDRSAIGAIDGQGDAGLRAGKSVQIPVNQVNVVSNQAGGVRERPPVPDSSPIRKTTQPPEALLGENVGVASVNHHHLDFLGAEMADLQQVLSSMASDKSSSYSVNVSSSSDVCIYPSSPHQQMPSYKPDYLPLSSQPVISYDYSTNNSTTCHSVHQVPETCTVCISLTSTPHMSASLIGLDSEIILGRVPVSPDTTWQGLEDTIQYLLSDYFKNLDSGLKTKKTTRLEPDPSVQPFCLGLSSAFVKRFSIGLYSWSTGKECDLSPYEIMANNASFRVCVSLGDGEVSPESTSFETLVPISSVQNYLRLIEQYKGVVFYGPVGSGKSLLANHLAHCIQVKESSQGQLTELIRYTCTESFSHLDLVSLLLQKGCIRRVGEMPSEDSTALRTPILVLNELDKINISLVFGDLLGALDNRGQHSVFMVKGMDAVEDGMFYFVDNFYLIATMDRTRSTGLDLSVQQRLRWVHFRVDSEPTKHMLARHLYRRLIHSFSGRAPPVDDPVYKAVEWVVCVWQRLNDGLSKLGLPEVVFGPGLFFSCPMEPGQPQLTLQWLCVIWNSTICPVVSEAVVKGTGTDTSVGGQQKVANTALYVLMQRAVVAGCPLSGTEKESYLSGFEGSNELEIPIRSSRSQSNSDIFLSPSSPLSPTVQLKSILSVTSPHTHSHKRASWYGSGRQRSRGFSEGNTDLELPHKIPGQRIWSSKSVSDTDLTASMPKVRRLEIRAPNLLNPSPIGTQSHGGSPSIIPRYSQLNLRSPSSSGQKILNGSQQDRKKGSFTFSPPTTTVPQFSFSNTAISSTFATKLPRAVKTRLSSVCPNGNKSSHHEACNNNELKCNDSQPMLSKISTPQQKVILKGSDSDPVINFSAADSPAHEIDTGNISDVVTSQPKTLNNDSEKASFTLPLRIETCSLTVSEPKTSPFRILQPSPKLIPKTSAHQRVGDSGVANLPPSHVTIEPGPSIISPMSPNARVFLLSGHKTTSDQTDNASSFSLKSPSLSESPAQSLGSIGSHGYGHGLNAPPDVVPAESAPREVSSELLFSPGRTEGGTALEALAKVLQEEERVSLC